MKDGRCFFNGTERVMKGALMLANKA